MGNAINAKTPGIFCWDSAIGNTFNRSITSGTYVTITNPDGITGNINIETQVPPNVTILGVGAVLIPPNNPNTQFSWGSTVNMSRLESFPSTFLLGTNVTPPNTASVLKTNTFACFLWNSVSNNAAYLPYQNGLNVSAFPGDIFPCSGRSGTDYSILRSFYAFCYPGSLTEGSSVLQYGTTRLIASSPLSTYARFRKATPQGNFNVMGIVAFICILSGVWAVLKMQDTIIFLNP